MNTWDDLNKELDKYKEKFILISDINELAIKFHNTKAIPLDTELADKYYKVLELEGYPVEED